MSVVTGGMDITVTFKPGRESTLALVRYKEPGMKPEYRTIEVPGPIHEHIDLVMEFALGRAELPAQMQGWLFEA